MLGFLVWAHHMFVAGISLYAALIFSFLSYMVAVPSAIKVFNWTATMYKGSITFSTPMLYAFGFIGLFTMGGLTGLFLAALGIDVHVTDTYFVVAHFHYIMVGGTVMGYLGGMHFWWPKISGRMYPEALGQAGGADRVHRIQPDVLPAVHSWLPGHAAALLAVSAGVSGAECAFYRRGDHSGGWIPASDGVFPVVHALWQNRAANPWDAAGLEWKTTSPPPTFNFDETPVVTWEAYDYENIPARRRRALADSPIAVEHHNPALRHHFADMEQQREASSLGMWLFLVTEIMFFGGMFCAYLIYRLGISRNLPPPAARSTSLATVNTAVLICSSLTVALAVRAAQLANGSAGDLSGAHDGSGSGLSRDQGGEWTSKFKEHHVPGPTFHFRGHDSRPSRPAGGPAARANFLLPLLCDDRHARAAHDHWSRVFSLFAVSCVERTSTAGISHAD